MRLGVILVLVVLASCGAKSDSGAPFPGASVSGGGEIDCEAAPVSDPVLTVSGVDIPQSGQVRIKGLVDRVLATGDLVDVVLNVDGWGPVALQMDFGQPVVVDVQVGSEIEVDYWVQEGFEGTARGVVIRDRDGLVLAADDGNYGNAIPEKDLIPFSIEIADVGCRNRSNSPGQLNNFRLEVSTGDVAVDLFHGEIDTLRVASRDYSILALRSVARVDGASWTDAPYEYKSFAIFRLPLE